MTSSDKSTRSHTHEIEIAVPVEAVWRAITEATELTRWYVEEARVTPGDGGTFWLSWGTGSEGESRIDAWEERRRLRLLEKSDVDTGPIAEEWTVEGRGGRTVLRIVHSGIPSTPDWDGFYDGTQQGWEMFLRTLRHYLERHPGQPRRTALLFAPAERPADTWARLTQALDLGKDTYKAGDLLTGDVLLRHEARVLLLSVDQLDDGLFSVALDDGSVWAQLSAYGPARERLDACAEPWRAWLADGLGLPR